MLLQTVGQRVDIGRIVVVGRNGANGRLPAHFFQCIERLVHGRCRGGSGILRVERKQHDTLTAFSHHAVENLSGRRQAIAHGPVDNNTVIIGKGRGNCLGLVAGDGFEGTFVEFLVPDLFIGMATALGPLGQDDAIENEPPKDAIGFDNAGIGQEFLQVAPHRPIRCGLGGAEVDEQNTDLAGLDGRMISGQLNGRALCGHVWFKLYPDFAAFS